MKLPVPPATDAIAPKAKGNGPPAWPPRVPLIFLSSKIWAVLHGPGFILEVEQLEQLFGKHQPLDEYVRSGASDAGLRLRPLQAVLYVVHRGREQPDVS